MILEVVLVASIAIACLGIPALVVAAHNIMVWLIHKTHLGIAYQLFHLAVY
uniref:Serine/threonine-protein kinase n=1 Tax=Rhizophora mucronata TaxID=61149 RepID=A0A2P2MHU1_RHIMU